MNFKEIYNRLFSRDEYEQFNLKNKEIENSHDEVFSEINYDRIQLF